MKIDAPTDTELEKQGANEPIAAATGALCGYAAVRDFRSVPGGGAGFWVREGRTAVQTSHRIADPLRTARERGTTRMRLRVHVEGHPYDVEVESSYPVTAMHGRRSEPKLPIPESVLRPRPPQKLPEDSVCRSPIAGRVIAVLSEAERAVRRNEPVVLIEAMKMEVPIGPAVDGKVKAIHVTPGQPVSAKQVLFELL